MKTAIFTLAALFGLGLGLAVVDVAFGLVILAALLAALGLAALIWLCAKGLGRLPRRTAKVREPAPRAPLFHRAARLAYLPYTPVLSALMGLSLGAALARDSADLPAALLCGGLAAALHLIATGYKQPAAPAAALPARISDATQADVARLIDALAPCRDPHLHQAARALRRAATALAARTDANPDRMTDARAALGLWLPALADAAERLRQQHLAPAACTPIPDLSAALTEAVADVTAHLVALGPEPPPPPLRIAAQPAH